jgi:iron complex outermembrane receptor protein
MSSAASSFRSARFVRRIGCPAVCAIATLAYAGSVRAQRAGENAVTEASDAFGTTVGREEVGLYSATLARGFNPSQAGNLRIDGLYFDQINQAKPGSRITRGSSVHVGISAQGFPFPAPTGVVDFHLRTPGEEAAGGLLLGVASYDQAYGEFDFQTPIVDEVLSIGGGIGYSRNSSHRIAELTDEWTAGGIARWQPTQSLTITPFWSKSTHQEYGERAHVFIGDSGWPRYRGVDLMAQPWADYGFSTSTFGSTGRYRFGRDWQIDVGAFYSEATSQLNFDPFLSTVNSRGEGDYSISAAPPRTNRSTSGEFRLTKRLDTENVRNTLYASVRGRDRSGESGGTETLHLGRATTSWVPQIAMPIFNPGATTLVEAQQVTPGVAYEGVWRNVGQLSVGVQKSFYDRTITAPNASSIAASSEPWLYNAGAAAFLSKKLVAYGSYTRGFEEIGSAPLNAANRDEAVPAQLTEQIDVGLKYQVSQDLFLVAGLFEIEKPYFDLDALNIYRQVGTTSNRGVELSLAGALTRQLTIVAGVILIDPTVEYDTDGGGQRETTAVGPIPGLIRANLQYRVPTIAGLIVDAKVESTSKRYARYNTVRLPAVTTVDAGVRYDTQLLGRNATLRLQLFNLTNEYGLTPAASGQLTPLDSRRFDLSLALDF